MYYKYLTPRVSGVFRGSCDNKSLLNRKADVPCLTSQVCMGPEKKIACRAAEVSSAPGSPEPMLLRMSVEHSTAGSETQFTGISMQVALTHLGLVRSCLCRYLISATGARLLVKPLVCPRPLQSC